MWRRCQHCGEKSCFWCNSYLFALKEIEKQDLEIKFPNNIWRIYLDTNEYILKLKTVWLWPIFKKVKRLNVNSVNSFLKN